MEAITREEQLMAAAAGQAVKLPEPITRREKFLKAIAERGGRAQPDMAQNDPSAPDYVKNRTHYDSRRTGEIKITFDGVLDGKEYIEVTWGGYCAKVSELTPSAEEMIGGTVELIMNGESTTIEITEDSIAPLNETLMIVCEAIFVCYGDTEFNGMAFTKGVHFPCNPSSNTYAANLSYTGTVGELKKLDEKYLPDSVQNKTYRFEGYSDGDTYVLEKGSYAEYMELVGADYTIRAEVVDYSENYPRIFPFVGSHFAGEFEYLTFQITPYDFDDEKLFSVIIAIGPSDARWLLRQYSPEDSGDPL